MDKRRFRRTLLAAAGGALVGGLGLLWYANRIEARRYKLERLKVLTRGRRAPHAGARPADEADSVVIRAHRSAPVYEGATTSGAAGDWSDTGGNGSAENRPHLHVFSHDAAKPLAEYDALRLRILHISDLHLCAPDAQITGKVEFLKRVTDDDYDLVVITGDIFENETGLEYARHIVSRKPRLGAIAVLGNHDYYAYTWFNKTVGRLNRRYRHPETKRDVQPFIDALADGGIVTLRNSAMTFPDDKVHVVGIDYPGTTQERLTELVSQAPDHFLNVALLHLPRRLQQLPSAGVHLAFAGHTHGGQVRIPGIGALITDSELPRHEASGLVQRGSTIIHVSRGIGADPKTNIRLFCPPAVTLLEVEHHA